MNQSVHFRWYVITFLFMAASLAGLAQEQPLEQRLDNYIQKAMADWQIPGLALAVVQDDKIVLAKGYGVRVLGQKAPVDAHTLFAVASNTKAFTAALLGIAVAEGKLGWTDHVADHLRDFQMFDPYVTREINIIDLLSHRSGLPTFGGDHLWIGGALDRKEILARIRYLEPSEPFRTRYQYQNLMFTVAGEVAAHVLEQNWEEALRQRIFKPIGMDGSLVSVRQLSGEDNVASPHEIRQGKVAVVPYDNVDSIAPAGAIISNVLDMSRWIRVNLTHGEFEGEQVLDKEIFKNMHRVHTPLPVSDTNAEKLGMRFSGYGLGWGISDYFGRKIISHGGGLSGMISRQVLVPDEKLGVVILTNLAPNGLPGALAYYIIDACLGRPAQDWSAWFLEQKKKDDTRKADKAAKRQDGRVSDTKPSLELPQYCGTYSNSFSGNATVRIESGKLVFDYNPRHRGDLEHWHYDTFRVVWRDPIFDMEPTSFLTFSLDDSGQVSQLEVTFYHPNVFQRAKEN